MLKNSKLVIAMSLFTLVGSASLAAAGARFAGPGGDGARPDRAELKKAFDRNGDGQLDETERAALKASMKARHAERQQKVLAEFDANRDGTLDDAERGRMMDQRIAEHFKRLDRDGNGVITLTEFKANAKERHQGMREGRKGKSKGMRHMRRQGQGQTPGQPRGPSSQ